MSRSTFLFCDTPVIACLSGVLVLPTLATLLVSDLHLEKGSRWARRGRLLPPYDTRATLAALAVAVAAYAPRRVICLGDSFDDRGGEARLSDDDAGRLRTLISGREWIWIAGNHDPLPLDLGGVCMDVVFAGPFLCRHAAKAGPVTAEISGHYHPKATVAVAGRRFSGRCFVSDGRRLILPAFGAYTGGLDVFDPALSAVLGGDFVVRLLGREQVHTFSARRLSGPRTRRPARTSGATAAPS